MCYSINRERNNGRYAKYGGRGGNRTRVAGIIYKQQTTCLATLNFSPILKVAESIEPRLVTDQPNQFDD